MSFQSWPDKDPDEVLDYEIDWTSRLDGDTISSSTWTVPDGLTSSSNTNTDSTVTIWLSGGTVGTIYRVMNEITTTGGRTMDQTVNLKISDK